MVTRDDVLDRALRHLNVDPTASMGAIAEAAGVSRATVHRHFDSREALVRELCDRSLDRWEESQVAAGIVAATTAQDAELCRAALDRLISAYVDDAEDFGFALTDCFIDVDPDLRSRTETLFELDIAFLVTAQEQGVVRRDLPARWLGHTLYGLSVAARDALRNGDVARRDLDAMVRTTFLDGASA
ncbi:TetR/AcrR family transcriptional regulator [Nocardioides alkalitolerans]|uniref:TetR/AcrR family transcriptional regulator n=1 Tax=Nocardioides alkalitolerans TaxID=281714 RepID=UPI000423A0E1|nr:TetR/AcrR family transcriptional regulator [Nocardioides alkalitolerans]